LVPRNRARPLCGSRIGNCRLTQETPDRGTPRREM
jgi:hypothetical protein